MATPEFNTFGHVDASASSSECSNYPPSVCDVCFNLDPDLIPQDKDEFLDNPYRGTNGTKRTATSGNLMRASATRGCISCAVLLEGVSKHCPALDDNLIWNPRECKLIFYVMRSLLLEATFQFIGNESGQGYEEGGIYKFDVEFYTRTDDPQPFPAFGYSGGLPTNAGLSRCVEVLRPWLEECSTKHLICNPPAAPETQLPTRLLDVGFLENGFIRLVESSRFRFTEYIALSHCWGEAQPMTTVKSNLRAHYDKIPYHQLPATFRDAVLLTSALKLRYLWIDSLCIVQDDKDDWEAEAGKMTTVYSCSYLTLAVLHSSNSRGGCFSHRYTKQTPGLWDRELNLSVPTESKAIQYRGRDGAVQTTMTRIKPDNAHSLFLGLERNDTPLGARAWALQERLLAPRTLYFHHEELVWECKASLDCECQNIHLFGYGLQRLRLDESTFCIKKDFHLDRAEVRNRVVDRWLRLVTVYSTLKLTKRSDVLPALSGMARHYAPFMVNGGYVAGLWSNDLPRSLMWQKVTQDYGKGLFTFHALPQDDTPSWSWVSVVSGAAEEDSQISYQTVLDYGFVKDPVFKICRLHVQSSPLNPFGSVSGGTIQVSGLCIATEVFEVFNRSERSMILVSYNGAVSEFSPDLLLSRPGQYQTLDTDSLYCLLIGETEVVIPFYNDVEPRPNGFDNFEKAQLVLVLKELREGDLRKFRRVGFLKLRQRKRWFDNAELVTIDII